jgi:hypothetical protein
MAVEIMSLFLRGSLAACILNLGARLRCVVSYMCLSGALPSGIQQTADWAGPNSVQAVRKNISFHDRESNPNSSVAQTVV